MSGFRITLGISLLLFFGCQSTVPTMQRLDDLDPFRFAPSTPPLVQHFDAPLPAADIPPDEPVIAALPPEPPEEPPQEEFVFEPEVPAPLSEAELVNLLLPDQWIKNLALINWLDSGRKRNLTETSLADRQRRDSMNLLNMSQADKVKRQHQKFDYVDGSASDWRWMHRGVDQLSSMPPERRATEVFWRNKKYNVPQYKILRANTAILLGRDGNPAVKRGLLQLVQDNTVSVSLRCAATEVLGRMSTTTADDLIPILDTVKDRIVETMDRRTGESTQQRQPGNTEVWEELLTAIAEKIDPWEHDCFIEPLYAPTSDIRIAAAKIWRKQSLQKSPKGILPEKFLEIAKRETNPMVRVEIIKTLGVWHVPDLFTFLENDLRHHTADIRNAAILALADARCQEAIPMVKDQLRDSVGANRAAAVSALRKLGAFDEVFKLVNDQDPLVRVEVAKAFSERCTSQTATFAAAYVSERNAKVQSATIEAVGGWSIEESGPLLLTAAKSFDAGVRCRATEMLTQRGVSCPDFNPEDRPENQTAQYRELVALFTESVGVDPMLDVSGNKERPAANQLNQTKQASVQQVSATVPEDSALTAIRRCLDDWSDRTLPQEERQLIQRRLAAHGQRLMPMIDHLMTVEKRNIPESLDRVFAEVDPMFQEIEKLKSDDLTAKQRAANELARLGAAGSPSKLAAKRLVDLAAKQDDARVLVSILSALKNADPELVCQLARPLLQSESAQVRRVSCEMLKQFGTSDDVMQLQDMLHDPSRGVVEGALKAIDALLEEGEDSPILETLKTMLMQGDPKMQIDVAVTLHRLEHSEGTEALRRLAASPDPQTKMYIARSVSPLGDPAFVPLLLRFLEDGNGSVRNEALKGLPQLAGEDIGKGGSTQQQIDRWKSWGKESVR